MRKAKAIYSELGTAMESAIITYVLAETQRQTRVKNCIVEKRKALSVPLLEAVDVGKPETGQLAAGHSM